MNRPIENNTLEMLEVRNIKLFKVEEQNYLLNLRNLKRLESISVGDIFIRDFDDQSSFFLKKKIWVGIVEKFPNLKSFTAGNIANNDTLHALCDYSNKIEKLQINSSNINDIGLCNLLSRCRKLQIIDIRKCYSVS